MENLNQEINGEDDQKMPHIPLETNETTADSKTINMRLNDSYGGSLRTKKTLRDLTTKS